jgi:enolase
MIKDLSIKQIFNSCKEKALKVSIRTEKGVFSASSPSGTSKGEYETKALDTNYIIKNFTKIKNKFRGKNEKDIDKIIEYIGIGKIGSNLSIALSLAGLRAISKNDPYLFLNPSAKKIPYPLGNVIGGGAHSGYLSEQEFLVVAVKAKTIKEATKTNLSIWRETGNFLKPFLIGRNRENAWTCKLNDLKSLEILTDIAKDFGARVGIDFAGSQIYKDGRYYYKHPDRNFSAEDQLDFILDLIKIYKLVYVEDPFHEDDFEHFTELTKKTRCLVTGDDLFATQPSRLRIGIRKKAGNAIIIKPNQAGTISKTLETVEIAKKAKFATIVSHRSCETNDDFISDLAVGIESPLLKCGIYGKERKAKLDRLVTIWNKLNKPEMSKVNAFI